MTGSDRQQDREAAPDTSWVTYEEYGVSGRTVGLVAAALFLTVGLTLAIVGLAVLS